MTNVDYWLKLAKSTPPRVIMPYAIVLVSIPLDDSVAALTDQAAIDAAVNDYINKLRVTTGQLRVNLCLQSKIIVTSPYPDSRFTEMHLKGLRKIQRELAKW